MTTPSSKPKASNVQVLRQIDEARMSYENKLTPKNPSRLTKLVDYVLTIRSRKDILYIYDELRKAGMFQDLRDINRTLVLRLMNIHLTDFQKREGRFPEFKAGCSEEEFMLAAWLHFQLEGPGIFEKESTWDSAPFSK